MDNHRRALEPAKVIDTIAALHRRISERFPGAGLASVCSELHEIAKENSARARQITRRNLPLRLAIFALLAAGAAGLAWITQLIYLFPRSADNVYSVLQGLEAAANLVVLLGAAIFFLFRIEARLKRRAASQALHALRRDRCRQDGIFAAARAVLVRGDPLSRLQLGNGFADLQSRSFVRAGVS